MSGITKIVLDYLDTTEVCAKGIATVESLAGGPPSTDLEYVLPGARSAVSFGVALDRDAIRAFLSKSDPQPHADDQQQVYTRCYLIAEEVAALLREHGHEAIGLLPNCEIRMDGPWPDWAFDDYPPISHRYMAVASGVGSFGWSGNVGIKGYGTAIFLGTCVTTAELTPTKPIPIDEGFCDNCKICVEACTSGRIEKDKSKTQSLGGFTYTHADAKSVSRCIMVCGGLTGLHSSGKWSSWSPGRFSIPEDEERIRDKTFRAFVAQTKWPKNERQVVDAVSLHPDHPLFGNIMLPTCAHCGLVCFGDKRETAKNLKLLRNSGCVIQWPDSSIEVMPADEAARVFAEMDPRHKGKYE